MYLLEKASKASVASLWKTQNNDGLQIISAQDSEYSMPVTGPGAEAIPGLGRPPRASYSEPARFSGFVPWMTDDGYVMECQRCLCKVSHMNPNPVYCCVPYEP